MCVIHLYFLVHVNVHSLTNLTRFPSAISLFGTSEGVAIITSSSFYFIGLLIASSINLCATNIRHRNGYAVDLQCNYR